MPQTLSGISGSGGVITTKLDEALSILMQMKKATDMINKSKIDPPVNTERIKELNQEISEVRKNVEGTSRTNIELFNTQSIQKNIAKTKTVIDGLYEKINTQGRKLTFEQSRSFVNSFKTLEKYGDRFGVDLTSKYSSIFNEMMQSLNSGDFSIAHVLENVDPGDFRGFISSIEKELNDALGSFQYSLRDAEDEATEAIIKQQTNALKEQKKQIQDTNDAYVRAEQEKKKAARATLDETVNGLKARLQSKVDSIGEDEFFNIDESKIIQFQELTTQLIRMMDELELETKDVSEIFEQLSSHIYIPNDVIKNGLTKQLEEAKQKIAELEEKITELEQKTTGFYTDDGLFAKDAAHADHILEYEHEIDSLKDKIEELEVELRYSVDYFSWTQKCEEVERLTAAVSDLKKQLHDLAVDNEILEDENRDLQGIHGNYENVRNGTNAIKAEGDAAESATKKKLAFVDANKQVAKSGDTTANSITSASSSIDASIDEAFELDPITAFINLLSEISKHLNDIKTVLGTVDDNNGFKSIITNLDIVLTKLDEVYSKIGTGVYNIDIHQGVDKDALKSDEAVKEYTRKTATRYQNAYDKLVSRAGNEELLFSYMNNILNMPGGVTELMNSYSSLNISKLHSSEEKIYRMIAFFKLLRQAAADESFGLDMTGITLPAGSDESFRSKLRDLSGLKKNQKVDAILDLDKDEIGLNDVIEKLGEIKELLSEISNKDFFGEAARNMSQQLDNIIIKFESIAEIITELSSQKSITTDQSTTLPSQIEETSQVTQALGQNVESVNNSIVESSEKAAESVERAKEEIQKEGDVAESASKKKEKFEKANQRVAVSGEQTEKSVQKAVEGLNAEGDAAVKNADKIKKSAEKVNGVFANQIGNVKDGNFRYVRHDEIPNTVEQWFGRVSTNKKTGAVTQTEQLRINYDKLLQELVKYDTQILKLTNQINRANFNTDGLERQRDLAQSMLDIYQDILNTVTNDDKYLTYRNQDQINYIAQERQRNQTLIQAQIDTEDAKKWTESSKQLTKYRRAIYDLNKLFEEGQKSGITQYNNRINQLSLELVQAGQNADKLKIVHERIEQLKIDFKESADAAKELVDDTKFDKLSNSLQLALNNMHNEASEKGIIGFDQDITKLEAELANVGRNRNELVRVQNEVAILRDNFKEAADAANQLVKAQDFITKKNKAISTLDILQRNANRLGTNKYNQEINNLRNQLKSANINDNSLKITIKQIDNLKNSINHAKESADALNESLRFKNQKTSANNELGRLRSLAKESHLDKFVDEIRVLKNELKNVGDNTNAFDTLLLKIDNLKERLKGALSANNIDADIKQYVSLTAKITEAKIKLMNLQNNPHVDQNSQAIQDLQDLISLYETLIPDVTQYTLTEEQENAVKIANTQSTQKLSEAEEKHAAAERKAAAAGNTQREALEKTRSALLKQIAAYMKNGKLMREYGIDIRTFYNEVQNTGTTKERLEQIRVALNKIDAQAKATGETGKTITQMIGGRLKALVAYLSSFVSFYRVIGTVRQAITTIEELDTEMVDLRKTTKMSNLELEKYYLTANDIAKQLGVTTKEVITQSAAWSRLGYNTKEATAQMAELSSKFAAISPGMDVDTAQEGLVSVMKAWDIDVVNVESQIMDKINLLGNNFAESNADIIAGMERSAAALSAVGTSYQDAFALFTGGQEILQNAEKMGTALRSISMRIRGVNEETEETDEELKNITGDLIDLTKTAQHSQGVSIFKEGSTTEFKSLVDYLREVSEVWDEMNDKQKNAYLQKAFAKTQAQAGAAILGNFDQVDKALEMMEDSMGSADREMAIIEESISYKINKLKETWTGFLQGTISRDTFGNLVDGATKFSDKLIEILNSTNLLKAAIISIGTVIGSQKLGLLNYNRNSGGLFNRRSWGFGETGLLGSILGYTENKEQNKIDREVIGQLRDKLISNGKTIGQGTNIEQVMLNRGASRTAINTVLDTGRAYDTVSDQVRALNKEMGKLAPVSTRIKNVLGSLGSSLINGALSAGITWLVTTIGGALISAIDKWIHRVENAKKAINDSISVYENSKEELSSLNQELETTQTRMDELLAKDSLTIVEQDELETLKKTNDQLERQIELKQRQNEIDARNMLDTIASEKDTVLTDVRRLRDSGYTAYATIKSDNDVGVRVDEVQVKNALEYNEALKEEEKELDRINALLRGGSIETIMGANGSYMKQLVNVTEEQREAIFAEFESVSQLSEYKNSLERNITKMKAGSEDRVYDLKSDLLQVEQWLDHFDEVGYENLKPSQQDAYDSLVETKEWLQNQVYNNTELFTIQLKAEIDSDSLQKNLKKIHTKLTDAGLFDNLGDIERKRIEQWLESLSEEEAEAIADSVDSILPTLIRQLSDTLTPQQLENIIQAYRAELSRGGNVNLNNRPEISTKFLAEKGWDVSTGWEDGYLNYATVDSVGYSNAEGTRYINFTPIIIDPETGKYIGVLTPEELDAYATEVIAGTRKDDLNLQIGVEFTTQEAADRAANAYHEMDALMHDYTSGKLVSKENGLQSIFNSLVEFAEGPNRVSQVLEELKSIAQETATAIKNTTDAVQELQDVADETKAVDSMAKMETALASLGDLYDQVIKKPEDASEDTLFGFADPTTINSIESAFVGLIETVDDADAKEKLSYALRDFETTLVEFPDDAEAAQNAMDKLLTAYMDQIYGLDNVTEENKKWTIALLKNKGIVNAEEVIESRLDKTNKRLLASEKKLSAVFRDNADALDEANKGTKEHEDALQALADEVNSMFSFSEDGIDFTMDIDADFVAEHLDLIRKVAAGDSEAIIELQNLLRQQMILDVEINSDVPQDIAKIQGALNGLLQVDLSNIEVGVDITEAQGNISILINAFQSWLEAGLMSVDEINNAFASIGAVPDITETKPVKMTVDSAIKQYGLKGSAAAAVQQSTTEITVNMPVLKYKKANNGAFSKGLKNMTYNKPKTKDTDKSGGGNSGGGSEEKVNEDTEESFNWIEVRLKRLQEAYTRFDKVSGAVYESWADRTEAVNEGLKITEEQLKAAEAAQASYLRHRDEVKIAELNPDDYNDDNKKQREYDEKQRAEAEKIWASGKYQKLMAEGKIGEEDIEKITNRFLVEAMHNWQELNDEAIAAGDSVRDYLDQRYNDYKKIFDFVKTEFDGIVGLFEAEADGVDKLIERTEEHGFFVSEKYYDKKKELVQDQIDAETRKLYDLTEARDKAVASGAIKEYSEDWYNMTNEIIAAENEVQGLYTELIQLDNQQRQLRWDGFDYAIDKLSEITNEVEFLQDLLDNKDLFEYTYDESGKKTYDGTMSDRGWASAGLHATEYNNQLVKAKYAAQELAKVEAELTDEKKKNDKNLLARRQEMLELQRDSIKAAEAEKEAIRDLVEEGINKHLEALQSLIDKYKEGLSDAKDLYDYQKNIASQTKQISSLQKQLSAYSGDDSEEARATIQKLQENLEEAETGLKETEWDKYISETNDMLDAMYEEYSNFLSQRLDDTDALMTYMTDQINARGEDIQTTIEDAADDYAYTTTTEFQSLFEGNGQLISDFNGNFNDFASTTIDALKKLVDNTLELTKGNNVMDQVESEGLTAKSGKSKNGWWYRNADGSFAANEYRDGYWYNSEGYWDNGSKAEWKSNSKGTWYQNADGWYPKNQWLKIDGDWYYFDEKGYMVTGDRQIGSKKHQFASSGKWLREYATGSKRITEDQLAWTQEQGSELIFRSSDGAMLTPLNKGDMVFTADMTKNLWDIAKNPAYANTTVKIPDSAVAARTINNDNALTVVLPNVQSYEDFKQALMKDKQITNFVQSATFGQALGKGQLNRGNY